MADSSKRKRGKCRLELSLKEVKALFESANPVHKNVIGTPVYVVLGDLEGEEDVKTLREIGRLCIRMANKIDDDDDFDDDQDIDDVDDGDLDDWDEDGDEDMDIEEEEDILE